MAVRRYLVEPILLDVRSVLQLQRFISDYSVMTNSKFSLKVCRALGGSPIHLILMSGEYK